jgi:hypothetical protein
VAGHLLVESPDQEPVLDSVDSRDGMGPLRPAS